MVDLPDASQESETERDGVLSYAMEWHALIIGLGAGLAAVTTGRYELLGVVATLALGVGGVSISSATVAKNVEKEPWYALGGLLFGVSMGGMLQLLALV